MRPRLLPLALAAVLGALASAAVVRAPSALAEDPGPKVTFPIYSYYPRGTTPELLDSRTGAVYIKNNSGGWELEIKPVGKE